MNGRRANGSLAGLELPGVHHREATSGDPWVGLGGSHSHPSRHMRTPSALGPARGQVLSARRECDGACALRGSQSDGGDRLSYKVPGAVVGEGEGAGGTRGGGS